MPRVATSSVPMFICFVCFRDTDLHDTEIASDTEDDQLSTSDGELASLLLMRPFVGDCRTLKNARHHPSASANTRAATKVMMSTCRFLCESSSRVVGRYYYFPRDNSAANLLSATRRHQRRFLRILGCCHGHFLGNAILFVFKLHQQIAVGLFSH